MQTLEERFWSCVWQCHHRHPCKRCCWPWAAQGIAIYADPLMRFRRAYRAARFVDPRLPRPLDAHVVAYILGVAGGTFVLPGRVVSVCHACDYRHCCNYAHLSLGAHADNMRDKRGKTVAWRRRHCVRFPDGSRFSPTQYWYDNVRFGRESLGVLPALMQRSSPLARAPTSEGPLRRAGDSLPSLTKKLARTRKSIYLQKCVDM